jgi:4-amino-4-deoxy-L-arabinose transferase-like glycosyltransferase
MLGRRERDEGEGTTLSRTRGLLLVLVAAALLLGARIGDLPLLDPDEAKHAQVAREMLEAERWLEPLVYGQPYHHKPSLLYALIGLCYRLFGVGELGARMVPAVAGLLMVALVYLHASRRRVADGLLASLLLMASALFFAVARFTNFDGLLALATFGAVVALSRWIDSEGGDTRSLVCGAALAAFGVLVKGPAAAVMLAIPVIVCGRGALRHTPVAVYLAATACFVGIVGAWLIPTFILHPEYVRDFLWVHNVQRYSVDADLFHPEPFWFFLPVLLVTLLPWSPIVPGAVVAAWRRGGGDRFLAVYAAWVVVFFSLSNGKLATYVLPAYPALAVLAARWLNHEQRRPRGAMSATAAVIFLLSAPAAYLVLLSEEPGFEHLAWALLPTAAAGAWVLASRRRVLATERGAFVAMSCALVATYAVALVGFAPAVGRLTSDRDLVAAVAGEGPPPDAVVVHRVRPFSFLFYSGWPVVYKVTEDEYRAALTRPGRVLVLTKDSRLDSLPATDPPLQLREIARNHRHVLYERRSR